MPIVALHPDRFEQLCANCGAHHELLMSALTAGLQRDEHIEPRVIALPLCSACGSREFLIRSAAAEQHALAPGSYAHRHRLLVDVLHDRLVQLGRVIDSAPTEPEAGPSESELARWFPDGLRLSPSAGNGARRPS